MIRGAIILGVGFSLGYAKALHDTDEIKDMLMKVIDGLAEVSKAASAENNTETPAETPADVVASDAIEVGPDTPIVDDTP